jgi:hypothetical protein
VNLDAKALKNACCVSTRKRAPAEINRSIHGPLASLIVREEVFEHERHAGQPPRVEACGVAGQLLRNEGLAARSPCFEKQRRTMTPESA